MASLERGIRILQLIEQRDSPIRLADAVTELGIPRSSAYAILRTMTAAGLLDRDEGAYTVGRRLYVLGSRYRSRTHLLRVARPILDRLRDDTGETAQLSVLDDGMVLTLLIAEGRQPIAVASHVGARIPVNWAAAGRLLLSAYDDDELAALLPALVQASPTGRAPTAPETLLEEVRLARRRGWAVQLRQSDPRTGAVAAPIIEAGRCIATFAVVAPQHRLSGAERSAVLAAVRGAAERASTALSA